MVQGPVDEDARPIAEADKLDELEAEPHHPPNPSGEAQAGRKLGHRIMAADGRHRAFVPIAEGAARSAVALPPQRPRPEAGLPAPREGAAWAPAALGLMALGLMARSLATGPSCA